MTKFYKLKEMPLVTVENVNHLSHAAIGCFGLNEGDIPLGIVVKDGKQFLQVLTLKWCS